MNLTSISLRKSLRSELELFSNFEKQLEVQQFIFPYDLDFHFQLFDKDPSIHYLTILNNDNVVGFFILKQQNEEIEFRRVVVNAREQGIGQLSILRMEDYCKSILNAKSIWLDVFEFNQKGKYIYEKLGYKLFDQQQTEKGILLFYRKNLY